MRFVIVIKTDGSAMSTDGYLAALGRLNEDLVNAGMLLAGDRLQAGSPVSRVRFHRGKTTVIDGPVTDANEVIAGWYLIQARSVEEAIEWAKRIPAPTPETVAEIDIYQVFEPADLGTTSTPALREQ